jgi:hypothetical protein
MLQKAGSQEVPAHLKQALLAQFRVGPEASASLRVMEKSGRFGGRRVRMFRIFDPGLLEGGVATKMRFEDLALASAARSVLFHGHVEADGGVYVIPAAANS